MDNYLNSLLMAQNLYESLDVGGNHDKSIGNYRCVMFQTERESESSSRAGRLIFDNSRLAKLEAKSKGRREILWK